MLNFKLRKGEIATLLTLGLVVIGAVITLGSSFFTNKQKSISSNPRASTMYSCCKVYETSSSCGGGKRIQNMGNAYQSTCVANGYVDCSSVNGPTTSGASICPDQVPTPTPTSKPGVPTSTPKPAEGITRYGSMNCTPEQICGGYDNYIQGSQYKDGSVRVVKCRSNSKAASPLSCEIGNSVPPSITPNPSAPKCTTGGYTDLLGCENVCGIGNCQDCKFSSYTTKYECKAGTSPLVACTKPRKYASMYVCEAEGCNNCTHCSFSNEVFFECGGSGPPITTPTPTKAQTTTCLYNGKTLKSGDHYCTNKNLNWCTNGQLKTITTCTISCQDDGKGNASCNSVNNGSDNPATSGQTCTDKQSIKECNDNCTSKPCVKGKTSKIAKWCCAAGGNQTDICSINDGQCITNNLCTGPVVNNTEANRFCSNEFNSSYVCCKKSGSSVSYCTDADYSILADSSCGASGWCGPKQKKYSKSPTNTCTPTSNANSEFKCKNDSSCEVVATPTLVPSRECTNQECQDPHLGVWFSYQCSGLPQNIGGVTQCPSYDFYEGKNCRTIRQDLNLNNIQQKYCSANYTSIQAKRMITISYTIKQTGVIDINPNNPTVYLYIHNNFGLQIHSPIEFTVGKDKTINDSFSVNTGTNLVKWTLQWTTSSSLTKTLSGSNDVKNNFVNLNIDIQ